MSVVETERLVLRRLSFDDAEFILELLNEPSWIRFIGDKGVRTIEDARSYIAKGPMTMYEKCGFGLMLTSLKESGTPIGICGLIKRDTLEDVDIGFAFLPRYWSKGYAYESAAAMIAWGRETFGLQRIVAITSVDNDASGRLLKKLGMSLTGTVQMNGEELKFYATGEEN